MYNRDVFAGKYLKNTEKRHDFLIVIRKLYEKSKLKKDIAWKKIRRNKLLLKIFISFALKNILHYCIYKYYMSDVLLAFPQYFVNLSST